MNWYKRYPSDYMGKTAHLSLTEHGAYNVLLDHCYSQETLSSDKDAVYRIARAFTQQERDAVDSVLLQYFVLTGDCYTNKRVAKELAKATEQSIQNSNNGKLGGRGIKRKESETKANALQNESETKAKQKALPDYQTTRLPDTTLPDARHETPEKEKALFLLPEWVDSELWTEWMKIRKKLKAVNSPRAMELLVDKLFKISQSGISVNTAIKTAIEKSWKSIELDWLSNQKKGKKDVYAQFLEGTKNESI
jgi:uncharacterized protein YdaU (DUF1376 family)